MIGEWVRGWGKGGAWEMRGPRAGGEGRIKTNLDSLFGCWIELAACLKGERWPHSKFHKRDVFGVCYMLVRGGRVHVPLFVRADTRVHPVRKKHFKQVIKGHKQKRHNAYTRVNADVALLPHLLRRGS